MPLDHASDPANSSDVETAIEKAFAALIALEARLQQLHPTSVRDRVVLDEETATGTELATLIEALRAAVSELRRTAFAARRRGEAIAGFVLPAD